MGKNTQTKITRQFSSGGAVFKKDKWLVTKSSGSALFPKQVWRLPKGHIDNGESTEQAALREVREEAGVEAKIIKKTETIKYFFILPGTGKILKLVTFFLMEWQKDLPDGHDFETAEVVWLSYKEAYKRLSHRGEKEILKKAKEMLG